MEPSKEAIAVRLTRLNRQILGKVTSVGSNSLCRRTIDREALLDALTVLYEECNDDPVKKSDELVRAFVDKYRSTLAELRRTRVCTTDFDILQTIGRGQFGEVHMVREKQTGDVYAMKTIRKEVASKRVITSAEDERDVLATGAGSWLPKLQYAFQDSSSLYLVMELCGGGSLAALLGRRARPLPERDAAFYVVSVTLALRALHDLGVVHRDLTPGNILLDRLGHVKLADLGSCGRLTSSCAPPAGGTADYIAPELLAAAHCAARHTVCLDCARGIQPTPITACDYWSLGVIAFELVTLKRPFSKSDDDSVADILANIQKYEVQGDPDPPFEPLPGAPSAAWRALTAGLLRVRPPRRFHYMDTLQHHALRSVPARKIRDQPPPWVPILRGPEDASYLPAPPREPTPAPAAPFRTRAPFAGQLPFVGFSYVAPEESEDSTSSGFSSSSSHDCTAIDLATFKSAEKLAAIRQREIASLQAKLAAMEAAHGAAAERARRAADDGAERTRARLQADITALTLQNKRLERQIEIEKEERMALERTNQELSSASKDRSGVDLRKTQAQLAEVECERNILKEDVMRLDSRVAELQAECDRALAAADNARAQQRHYKDSVAKERALRRQTLSGFEEDTRAATVRIATAEASAAQAARAQDDAERRLADAENRARTLQIELDDARREAQKMQQSYSEKRRLSQASNDELKQVQTLLTQERVRSSTLQTQVKELQQSAEQFVQREAALEEQCARTEARLLERLEAAETRAADALHHDNEHREKVTNTSYLLEEQCARTEARLLERLEAAETRAADALHHDNEHREKVTNTSYLLEEQCARTEARLLERLEAAETRAADALHHDNEHREKVTNTSYLLEEQCARTEARLLERLEAAETRAADALHHDNEHREKVTNTSYLLEEQCARTEARLLERLEAAETRAADALHHDNEHREKVSKLEHLVRQLEREVSAFEHKKETTSDTESTCGAGETETAAVAQLALLKEQRERAEAQLQTKHEEIAALRQEARTANLARWRKEREYTDLAAQAKTTAAQLKRLEERVTTLTEARKSAEQKALAAQTELDNVKPQLDRATKDLERTKERLERLNKTHDTVQAEVDRLRNDILKLKSELQYSEKRRLRAEQQEELGSKERAQLRDEATELRATAQQLEQNNKALQEACGLLEEQLTDLEKLADLHELKNNDLESETERFRSELSSLRERLVTSERAAAERGAGAARAQRDCDEARARAEAAEAQLQLMQERVSRSEERCAELEATVAALSADKSALAAAADACARRVQALQEECASLRTRAHEQDAQARAARAHLREAREEIEAAREAADAAAAWWRTRETKADATLRQQTKLIDFLQAKVEEAKRKKSSLGNKLFGRSGRRPAVASPPLRRANRELREENDRLRSQLSAASIHENGSFHATPRRERSTKVNGNVISSIDTPDGLAGDQDTSVQIVWPNDSRERAPARMCSGALEVTRLGRAMRARLLTAAVATRLPNDEAARAFTIKFDSPVDCPSEAVVICPDVDTRDTWLALLARGGAAAGAGPGGYRARQVARLTACAQAALYVADNALAFGTPLGVVSLRGAVRLVCGGVELAPGDVTQLCSAGPRALLIHDGKLYHGGMLALASSLRRASVLCPAVHVERVELPDAAPAELLQELQGGPSEEESCACVAVSCGRRVLLLRWAAAAAQFQVSRAVTVDRAPLALLLTARALYVAGARALRLPLPAGALEPLCAGGDVDPSVSAAAARRSPPRALLLLRREPAELLLCFAEYGVFVDERGRRTRDEDLLWKATISGWQFERPFLYVVGAELLTAVHLHEAAYRAAPCTCAGEGDERASTPSERYVPATVSLPLAEPRLLARAPGRGVLVRHSEGGEYVLSLVEGAAAFRAAGASLESLESATDPAGSAADLAGSAADLAGSASEYSASSHDSSSCSRSSAGSAAGAGADAGSGFLADIRKRAEQLRRRSRRAPGTPGSPDAEVKRILAAEVSPRGAAAAGAARGAGSSAGSEFSDTESEGAAPAPAPAAPRVAPDLADLCGEMFARQVRFQ